MKMMMTMKHKNCTLPEKMQLSYHLPYRTTPNYFGITKGVMRNTTPAVFCFSRCPYSLVFQLHLTQLITLPLGTFLPLDFLPHYYLLLSLGQLFLWIQIFLFSRGFLSGLEGQEPHPGENLDVWGASSCCPVTGYWHVMWGRWGKGEEEEC